MRRPEAYRLLAGWLKAARDIALVCHVSPDGDTLGSALALKLALDKLGKRAVIICQDETPALYSQLPGIDAIITPGAYHNTPDIAVFLDISTIDRAGEARALLTRAGQSACVDHHIGTEQFAGLTLADPGEAATGVMIYRLIRLLGISPDYDIALCLYTAVATDTGNFSFANTNARALKLAASCLSMGVPVAELTMRYFTERSRAAITLLGGALSGIEYHLEGAIAVMRLSESDFLAAGATRDDEEGFVNIALAIKGVEVAVYLRARGDEVKCSLRSRDRAASGINGAAVDVAEIARELGGGGHRLAAGATLKMSMERAQHCVLMLLRSQMRDK